ncbi:MAG: low molecular weight protein-tyrosine-phosphatase [Arenicellales bacterium]|jgi:protein-tyrosine phosphatase|nr:low molecular weight protein-tyrosine-phosphatase [Arenicellales bacterium]MDP6313776.1 low molecular weight protein-tyrosine-phosphatase [Arenicellales bacterium]MDP7119283.1 low molecular weight protein-tyrosine-phosphatase [Arenicellales bacterium]MDP7490283.1 low molecular weight protein-tyrosine-phosphatase [Arenicellales bacterium]MDP7524473.1 low molecular weight protein-tyrosine-phosphatase [Arenicellales bacterium]|tara:strand:- start:1052 stop:1552 length:501 start_codon:yes stop_codon:yes gene_type:complete
MNSARESAGAAVLFVCLGNICRSPTAEGVFRGIVKSAGLEDLIRIDSAGTHGYHVGEKPDPRAVAAAQLRQIDLSAFRGRQADSEDFYEFDFILAMDRSNLSHLARIAPPQAKAQLDLLLDFATDCDEHEVPDPYYGGNNGFERVLDLIENAATGLLSEIRSRWNI